MENDQAYRVAAMGFWLPCNRSFFFEHGEDLNILERIPQNHQLERREHEQGANRLQASVFNRLMTVLPAKGYSYVYPVPDSGHERVKNKVDPLSLVFTATIPENIRVPGSASSSGAAIASHICWPNPTRPLQGLALFADANGFYVWVAVYVSQVSDRNDKRSLDEEAEQVQVSLQGHILDAVGGDYYSHFSGLTSDEDNVIDADEKQHNLLKYRDTLQGVLTFFQINTILEGMYNATFDPRIFFAGESNLQTGSIEEIKRTYSLGKFVNLIAHPLRPVEFEHKTDASMHASQHTSPAELGDSHLRTFDEATIAQFIRVLETQSPLSTIGMDNRSHSDAAAELAHAILCKRAYAHILRRFSRATADQPLQTLKRRIERCRRALLSEMLEITHRRLPLLQVEPPDDIEDRIDGVNETQLRGYVMLLAAKLPLITNVRIYLDELAREEKLWDHHQGGTGAYHAWNMLLTSIQDDIKRLEIAVDQATQDRQLYEQEQIRAEQETLNELERLRSRTDDTFSPTDSLSINFISNFLALSAVVLTLFSVLKSTPTIHFPEDILKHGFLEEVRNILLGAMLLTAVYVILQKSVTWAIRKVKLAVRKQRQQDERYYYEFDVHLQAPISPYRAEELFESRFYEPSAVEVVTAEHKRNHKSTTPWWRRILRFNRNAAIDEEALKAGQVGIPTELTVNVTAIQRDVTGTEATCIIADANATVIDQLRSRYKQNAKRDFTKPERSSYRIQRMNKDSAMHKVYIEADVFLAQRAWWRPWPRSLHAILVYELVFHRPAQNHSYILQDLRVVINYTRMLDGQQIDRLKHVVADRFIDHWLDYAPAKIAATPLDALFTLNRTREQSHARPQGRARSAINAG